jgi:hypothetical protein
MDLHMVSYAAHDAQLMCSDHAHQCAPQCRTQMTWNFLDILSFSNKRVRKNFKSTSTVLSKVLYCESTHVQCNNLCNRRNCTKTY